jgi:MYXO-CTERM domain-containing protein
MGFIDAADFLTSTGAQLFEVVQDTDAVPNMSVEHNLTTAGGTTLPKFSLTNSGELITLFTWDGQSALIQDLDSVTWGPVTKTLSSGVIPNVIDKTNEVAHDGTAYQTDNGSQHPNLDALKVPRNGSSTLDPKSIHRVRLDEVGEQLTGGNGENGHDESTEDWLQTFEIRSMNPGEVPFGAPAVAIDPTIDFGGVAFGQTEAFEVTIENTGQVALLVSDIRLAPAAGQQSVPAEYTVDASGVPLVLGAGESMTRDITFTADINFPGVRAVDLVVVTNDPVHAVCVIPTTAEAVEPAEIAVNPDTIIFASTLVSNTREETFTISNVGQSDLHINAITFDDAQFSLLEPDAFVIAPGDSAVRTVQFAPAQETDVTATLTIASNDPNAAQSQITLIGTSVDLGRSPSSCSVSKSGSAPAGAPLLALALGLFGMAWVRRSRRVTA